MCGDGDYRVGIDVGAGVGAGIYNGVDVGILSLCWCP